MLHKILADLSVAARRGFQEQHEGSESCVSNEPEWSRHHLGARCSEVFVELPLGAVGLTAKAEDKGDD